MTDNKIAEIVAEIEKENEEMDNDEKADDEKEEPETNENEETNKNEKINVKKELDDVEETLPCLPPMTPSQMQAFLIGFYGIPIALRKQGDKRIVCPYCKETHIHSLMDRGYVTALCENRENQITVNDRTFLPNYGYTMYEYASTNDNARFKIIEDLL